MTLGYRAFLPYRLCLKSVFIWSNETINIWTHLIGESHFVSRELRPTLTSDVDSFQRYLLVRLDVFLLVDAV